MKNIFKFTFLFALFLLLNCEKNNNIYQDDETFFGWGLNNKLGVSSFIEPSIVDKKKKIKFIAIKDIPANQDLLTIPYSLMFNVNKALELINIKTLDKQHHNFEKLNTTNLNFRKEKSFFAYILYLIKHKPKKYQKTKFYEFYKKYLELLKEYRPKSPLFYDPNQVQYLAGTLLDRHLDGVKNIYEEEIEIYSNKSFYKKELDFDEYAQYRLVITKYGLNILDKWTIVPFLNYFDDDYSINNANYTIQENGDLKIYSLKEIKKGEVIILQSPKLTNMARLILEGKTNEELVDYFTEYIISAFSPGLYYNYGISDIDYFKTSYINILEKDYDKKLVKIYQENADLLQGDGTEIWAYDIVEMNMNFYKEHFESITMEKIYDIYYDKVDRINIERIIRGERKVIVKAYEDVNKVIDVLVEEEQRKKRERRAKKEEEEENKDNNSNDNDNSNDNSNENDNSNDNGNDL